MIFKYLYKINDKNYIKNNNKFTLIRSRGEKYMADLIYIFKIIQKLR
jgi:hypothetical protein